jgi:uncharacterized membrane protein
MLKSYPRALPDPYKMKDKATIVRESPLRSVLKGLTWRIIATTTTIVIALIVTGDIKPALKIGAVEFFAKFVVYYLHERAWARAPLGSVRRLLRSTGTKAKD